MRTMKLIVVGLMVLCLSAGSAFAIGQKGNRFFNPKYALKYQTCKNTDGTGGGNFSLDANGQKVLLPTKAHYGELCPAMNPANYPAGTFLWHCFSTDKPEEYLCP